MKLPADAFGYYVALGPARSYQAVADHFGVAKRTVVREAARDGWPARLQTIELKARESTDKKLADDLSEMETRHRRMLRAMASRAAKGLSELPITNGMQAIKAAEIVIKLERLLAGEPGENEGASVEQIIKREFALLMTTDDEDKSPPADESDEGEQAA